MDKSIDITEEVLEKINVYSVKPLTAEEVYCFSVLLCDNEIDRDYERFSAQSLKTLAELYIGRTGIFDHNPKGENQTARIYHTEVKSFPDRKTGSGETYTALMGHAYMVRTEDNKSLIAEIDGGIKKEVSVGCAVGAKICSVCGADMLKNPCSHIRGKYYGEKLCFATLENPTDAYEWSFVAVPAQRNAGVTKTAKSYADAESPESRDKMIKLCDEIRGDIIRLSYFTKPFISAKAVKAQTEELNAYELIALKKSLEKQVRELNVPTESGSDCNESCNDGFSMGR